MFQTLNAAAGNRIVALLYPGGAALSRREFDALTEIAKGLGAKGLPYLALAPDGVKGSIAKMVTSEILTGLLSALTA